MFTLALEGLLARHRSLTQRRMRGQKDDGADAKELIQHGRSAGGLPPLWSPEPVIP